MDIRDVTSADFDGLEGNNQNSLHAAVIAACPGLSGETLWEQIRFKFDLGHKGPSDVESVVHRMNVAIGIWRQSMPTDCESVRAAYGI